MQKPSDRICTARSFADAVFRVSGVGIEYNPPCPTGNRGAFDLELRRSILETSSRLTVDG